MILRKTRYWQFFLITLASFAVCFGASEENVPTNNDIFSRLCAEATDSVAAFLPQRDSLTIAVVLGNDSASYYFRSVILESLKKHCQLVFLSQNNSQQENAVDAIVSLAVSHVSVRYENPFSESFLGERKATRKAELHLRGTIVNAVSNQVLWAGAIERSFTDTILVSQIGVLEFSSKGIAQGIVPEAPFLERLVEPMIIIAATGIAVYLFFTIRG